MKHAIGYSVTDRCGGIAHFTTVDEMLKAHPLPDEGLRHEAFLRTMEPDGVFTFETMDGAVISVVRCDVATPEDYPADVLELGQRFHDALLALASAIQAASHAPRVTAALYNAANRARAKASVGQHLAGALGKEVFEPSSGEPVQFKLWVLDATDRIALGAGPDRLHSDAADLARNMGLDTLAKGSAS